MMYWQNGFLGVSKAAALGWARGPGKHSERRSRQKAFCPNGMRSFQNELHHYYHFKSEVVLKSPNLWIHAPTTSLNGFHSENHL